MSDLQAITPVKSIREVVYDKIKSAILDGAFGRGERLVEHDIAEKLQVSRTPVREALKRLESEGILQALPRQGLIVKMHTEEEIREIYMIREALESLAAEQAAINATDGDVALLEELVWAMGKLDAPDRDPNEAMDVHRKFSESYNRASHMPTLVHIIESLKEQIAPLRRVSLSKRKRRVSAHAEHEALLKALKERKPDLAAELTRTHIRNALEAYFDSETVDGGEKRDK